MSRTGVARDENAPWMQVFPVFLQLCLSFFDLQLSSFRPETSPSLLFFSRSRHKALEKYVTLNKTTHSGSNACRMKVVSGDGEGLYYDSTMPFKHVSLKICICMQKIISALLRKILFRSGALCLPCGLLYLHLLHKSINLLKLRWISNRILYKNLTKSS